MIMYNGLVCLRAHTQEVINRSNESRSTCYRACVVFAHAHCPSRSTILQNIRTFISLLSICYGVIQCVSSMDGDSNEVFPAEDHLFKDSFSADKTFTFFGQKFIINEVFGGNLGVAASVWDAVSFNQHHFIHYTR